MAYITLPGREPVNEVGFTCWNSPSMMHQIFPSSREILSQAGPADIAIAHGWNPMTHHFRDVQVCDTFFSRFRGLMFSPRRTVLLAFERDGRHSIHMLFVFFPIVAVWLDAEDRVVHVSKAAPFSPLHRPRGKARKILEIPAEKAPSIEPGDQVLVEGTARNRRGVE